MCPLQCSLPAGKEFPNSFESLVKKICRNLFHVLAHIYWAHFKETVALDLHGHLNTLYAHFIVFVREFNLVDPKETCIMDDLSEVLCTPLPSSPQQNHVTERWATVTEPPSEGKADELKMRAFRRARAARRTRTPFDYLTTIRTS